MARLLIVFIAAMSAFAVAAAAQPTSDRVTAIAEFSEDLAELQAIFPNSETEYMAMQAGALDSLWERAVEKARQIKESWDGNPYVEVTGFSVSIGLSPAIDLQFTFKD